MKFSLLVLFSYVIAGHGASKCPKSNVPLVNEAIHQLDFELPDIEVQSLKLLGELKFSQIDLKDICVQDISATFSDDSESPLLQVTVKDLDAELASKYELPLKVTGNANIILKGTDVTFTVQATKGKGGVLKSISVPSSNGCSTNLLRTLDVKLDNFVIEKGIKLLKNLLGKKIEHMICDKVSSLVNTKLNQVVEDTYSKVSDYLDTPATPVPPSITPNRKFENWNTFPLIKSMKMVEDILPRTISDYVGKFAKDGVLSLNTSEFSLGTWVNGSVADVGIFIESVAIKDLRSIDKIAPLFPGKPNYELWSEIETNNIIHADIILSIKMYDTAHNLLIDIHPTLRMQLDKFHMFQKSLLPVDKVIFESLTISQVIKPECLSMCMNKTSQVYDVGFNVTLSKDAVEIVNTSAALDKLFKQLTSALDVSFVPYISVVLSNYVRKEMPRIATTKLQKVILDNKDQCPAPKTKSNFVDWRNNAATNVLNSLINKQLLENVDSIVDKYIHNGNIDLPEDHTLSIKDIDITLSNLKVIGLDSLYDLELFKPNIADPYRLKSSFGIGNSTSPNKKFELSFELDIKQGESGEKDDFILSISFTNLEVELDTIVMVDQTEFENLSLSLFTENVLKEPCLYVALHKIQIQDVTLSHGDINLDLDCKHCSSKELQKISNTLNSDAGKQLFSDYLGHLLDKLFPKINTNLKDLVNGGGSKLLKNLYQECKHPGSKTNAPTIHHDEAKKSGFGTGAVVGLSVGAVALVLILVVCVATPSKASQDADMENGTNYHALNSQDDATEE